MKYTDEQILGAVKASNTWTQVYRTIVGAEVKPSPGMQAHFKRRAVRLGADFSHFRFQRKPKPVVDSEPVNDTTTPPQ